MCTCIRSMIMTLCTAHSTTGRRTMSGICCWCRCRCRLHTSTNTLCQTFQILKFPLQPLLVQLLCSSILFTTFVRDDTYIFFLFGGRGGGSGSSSSSSIIVSHSVTIGTNVRCTIGPVPIPSLCLRSNWHISTVSSGSMRYALCNA